MKQAFIQAVKLPTLLQIPQPNTSIIQERDFNVEGKSSATLKFNSANKRDAAKSRSSLIASVLEEEKRKSKEPKGSAKVTCVEMIEMINEKLNTGYHGVKHLFKGQNPHKPGILNKEGFKHVIISLCGYIPPDEWTKVLKQFNLDNKKDTISFEEFISHFDKNEKVKKELKNANRVEMIDINSTTFLNDRNINKSNNSPPEVSAIYSFALLKAKVCSRDFKPSSLLPEECIKNDSLILPFHVDKILDSLNIKLIDSEFKKLWRKFDLENVGGIKPKVFLRLLNYNPNEIDEITTKMDNLRTKSCIVSSSGMSDRKSSKNSFIAKKNEGKITTTISLRNDEFKDNNPIDDDTSNNNNTDYENKNDNSAGNVETIEIQRIPPKSASNEPKKQISGEAKKPISIVESQLMESEDIFTYYTQRPDSADRGTTLSESKIRHMVQQFKSSLKLKPKDNIVEFLNNKINAGYIGFRTAFEYIDPDNYGYLLNQEFEAVLKEFDIEFKPHEYSKFLKQHGFMKRNNLVNYKAFLYVFHDQNENSITQQVLQDAKSYIKYDDSPGLTAKQADFKLVNLFHGFYLSALDCFKQALTNQDFCTAGTFKNLLEKAFSIKIDQEKADHIVELFSPKQKEDNIQWLDFFLKFSQLE